MCCSPGQFIAQSSQRRCSILESVRAALSGSANQDECPYSLFVEGKIDGCSLHGFDQYTWVVTAYLLATTAVVPLAGKLSDQFGRKSFFLSGIFLFLLGSVLASGWWLSLAPA